MEQPPNKKEAGIIVDAASFHHMMKGIGIGQASLNKLTEVISWEVSMAMQASMIIGFSQYITAAEDPERFAKREKAAGMQFISTDHNRKGSDDEEVNRCIALADPEQVAALVVVSADLLDYVQNLEIKRSEGIRIFVAAITIAASDGHFPLSMYSRHIMKENHYTLIDMERYKSDLLVTEWVDREDPHEPHADATNAAQDMPQDQEVSVEVGELTLHEWIHARCRYLYARIRTYADGQNLEGIQAAGREISSLLELARIADVLSQRACAGKNEETIPEKEDRKKFSRKTMIKPQERREKIIAFLRTCESVSMNMLAREMPDVATAVLLRDLRSLKEKGLVRSTGGNKWIRYRIVHAPEEKHIEG